MKAIFIGIQQSEIKGYEFLPLFNVVDKTHPKFEYTLTINSLPGLFTFDEIQWCDNV